MLELPKIGFLFYNNSKLEKEQEKDRSPASTELNLRKIHLFLNYNYNHEKPSQAKRDIEEMVEDIVLLLLQTDLHDLNSPEKRKRQSCRKLSYEQNESLNVIAIKSMVYLRDNRTAQPLIPLQDPQHHASALWEVLNAGDQGSGVGERL